MSYSIKSIREQFKARGVFYTPPELSAFMRGFFPEDVREIYDPTCGHGNLLSAFGDAQKFGQDVNAEAVEHCHAHLTNFHGIHADTLTDHFRSLGNVL